jgi:hypothetical protein
MDAWALLETVAETYASLKSLAVEILITNESGDDGVFNHSEQRARAFFVAPDKLRIEQGGRHGSVTVTNGIDIHHYLVGPKRYLKRAVEQRDQLPGWFRPEFPVAGGPTILFSRIAERVAAAEILREEPVGDEGSLCQVLSVAYEPSPYPNLTVSSSPVLLWVNSHTHLISRMEGETTHRLPAHDETHTNKRILTFTRAIVNEPIPAETFEFSPPADAVDVSDPRHREGCAVVGGGGGSAHFDPEKGQWFESWRSHDWAGDTLIERSRLKLHGLELSFERRLTVSDDRKELRIVERISARWAPSAASLSLL